MTISKQLEQYAENAYQTRLPFFGRRRESINHAVEQCPAREKVLMKFLYGTMPLRDAGEYDFSLFYSFVSHALMLADTMDWCRSLPEDIFLHYILYYRINSESIEDCRSFFYEQLLPRITGLSAKEAALEINYWCAENGSYESTDSRTVSPLTFYRSGKGRCGEESVFAVTAFRSVGIPARQIYTPRWAHCDDNHAWLEVYIDEQWHFLGACEPEEVLDKGWFSHASSRALFIHSLTFSDYTCQADHREEYIGREGQVFYHNHTAAYAKTRKLNILVRDMEGNPVSGALVLLEIFNMAEYSCGAALITDNNGQTSITLGLGDIHLHAEKDGCCCECTVSVRHTHQAILLLPLKNSTKHNDFRSTHLYAGKPPVTDSWEPFTVEAPQDNPLYLSTLTREQKKRNRKRLIQAENLRKLRFAQCIPESLARDYPGEIEIFRTAAGNLAEIASFLCKDESPDRRAMLHHLKIKDAKDARADILNSHLHASAVFRQQWEKQGKRDIYVRCLLSPRIYLEELTDYREYIQTFFTEQEKLSFRENPASLWKYIQQTISYHADMDYETLCSTPKGCLELSHGSKLSQNILFAAVCRTLGIPSRINAVNLQAQYYRQNQFISVEHTEKSSEKPASLTLISRDPAPWRYFQHWSIGRLEGCRFITLDYSEKMLNQGNTELYLAPGTYRLFAANRLPNGNQKAAQYLFTVSPGQKKEILMYRFSMEKEDMLAHYHLDDMEVFMEKTEKETILLSSLLQKKANLLAFLQEGEEPTEHVLNELLEQKDFLPTANLHIIFVLKNQVSLEHITLNKVLTQLPQITVVYGDFDELAEPAARQLYTEPEKFPLLALLTPEMNAVYADCGYRAGIIGMLLRITSLAFSVPI